MLHKRTRTQADVVSIISSARTKQGNLSTHAQGTKRWMRNFRQNRRRRRGRQWVKIAQATLVVRISGQPQCRQLHPVRGATVEISSHKFNVRRNQCNMHQAHQARSGA